MLREVQSTGSKVEANAVTYQVDHLTWIDTYSTFFALPATDSYKDNATVVDAHRFGDEEALTRPVEPGPVSLLLLPKGAPGGLQVRRVAGVDLRPILDGVRLSGHTFEDADARYCILGNVKPGEPSLPRGGQATEIFEKIQDMLASAGMDFRHVVRTWFYNDRLLDWYGEFNRVRTGFFKRHGITRIPASTGIGVANPGGFALVAKVIAVMPKTNSVSIRWVESPLQKEATSYGSAFSRAVEVADRNSRMLYISGTASIGANGESEYVGDVAKQIKKTMEVVEAILEGNGMKLSDTVRAIGYFRNREHIPLWHQYCRARRMPKLPIILTECEVCREELLFEIELDAGTERLNAKG